MELATEYYKELALYYPQIPEKDCQCSICGKELYQLPYKTKFNPCLFYCSKDCYFRHNRDRDFRLVSKR